MFIRIVGRITLGRTVLKPALKRVILKSSNVEGVIHDYITSREYTGFPYTDVRFSL
jgi:hypothetical protein